MPESTSAAKKVTDTISKKIIFVDPGHGGLDLGAQGPNGGLEKKIVFALAKELSAYLNDNYDCVLTRTDDYNLPLFSRSEAANHAGADLFISLHAGGSFRHQSIGMTVFYSQGLEENEVSSDDALASHGSQTPWSRVQQRHLPSSRQLANHVQNVLQNEMEGTPCHLRAVPLVVLAGVDMPAILIEIGYITNPKEERRLKDPAYLSKLASVIGTGIKNFLTNQSTIFSIDLHE